MCCEVRPKIIYVYILLYLNSSYVRPDDLD